MSLYIILLQTILFVNSMLNGWWDMSTNSGLVFTSDSSAISIRSDECGLLYEDHVDFYTCSDNKLSIWNNYFGEKGALACEYFYEMKSDTLLLRPTSATAPYPTRVLMRMASPSIYSTSIYDEIYSHIQPDTIISDSIMYFQSAIVTRQDIIDTLYNYSSKKEEDFFEVYCSAKSDSICLYLTTDYSFMGTNLLQWKLVEIGSKKFLMRGPAINRLISEKGGYKGLSICVKRIKKCSIIQTSFCDEYYQVKPTTKFSFVISNILTSTI